MNSNSILKLKESAERVSWSALEATAKDAARGSQTNPPSFYMEKHERRGATDPAGAGSASAEAEHCVPTATAGAD